LGECRGNPFDAFALDDPANGEHSPHAFAAAGNDGTAEHLDAFLLTFQNALVHIDLIADRKVGDIFFQLCIFDECHQFIFHGFCSLNCRHVLV